MKRSKSSGKWLAEHFSDVYVKRAKSEGFRARSVYKLMEIQKRYKIIKPGMVVVDLGAAPGGWSEYVAQITGVKSKIVALDILPMHPINGVEFMQGDFSSEETVKKLFELLSGKKVDIVLSDMAPNFSGLSVVDQAKSMNLVEMALFFARKVLRKGGVFFVKVFQGAGFEDFLKDLRASFEEVKIVKPDASRMRSKEIYLLAKGYKAVENYEQCS